MARRKMNALLGAVSVTATLATLAVATPAHADAHSEDCASSTTVVGYTESNGQGTYIQDLDGGYCGRLGVRVNYNHVGGNSWTSWKYSTGTHHTVSRNISNPVMSQHSTGTGNRFYTDL